MNDDDVLYHRLADCLGSVLAEASFAHAHSVHPPSRPAPSPPSNGGGSPKGQARS